MSQPVLALQNINKQFGHGHTAVNALTDANFEVSAGQFVAIIGPSGSGKSTFLTIAAGLQTPTSGQVILNGTTTIESNGKTALSLPFQ
jgi:putative ABC transport system ATP-binding protein